MSIDDFVMCGLTVVPVRLLPDDTSEMVTQLLFGETARVIEIHKQWLKVEITYDEYQGWVDNKQLYKISDECAKQYSKVNNYQSESELIIRTPWGLQRVLQGSPILSSNKTFNIDEKKIEWVNNSPLIHKTSFESLISDFINVPYLWGGRTKYGIDCSGFTQIVYRHFDCSLPRDANQQILKGDIVNFENRKQGDLAFFKSEQIEKITHVGIVLKDSKIMHIHGRGRIDTLDENGIFNEHKQYYSHKFDSIKRYKL